MSESADLQTWQAWHEVHQRFELGWWREALAKGHSLNNVLFAERWQPVRDFIRPEGLIIDIGCGPRPPFAPCVVIEPLAKRYQAMSLVSVGWWVDVTVYAQPAEKFIEELWGAADTVICWNCIDHAVGWREILTNMRLYGKPTARFAVATDFHEPFIGHPGFEREAFMAEIGKQFVVTEQREDFRHHLALLMQCRVSK